MNAAFLICLVHILKFNLHEQTKTGKQEILVDETLTGVTFTPATKLESPFPQYRLIKKNSTALWRRSPPH